MSKPRTISREEVLSLLESPPSIELAEKVVNACAIVLPAKAWSDQDRRTYAHVVETHEQLCYRLVTHQFLTNVLHTLNVTAEGTLALIECLYDDDKRAAAITMIENNSDPATDAN